jgi:pimeloyl-ACP methyl ester carboxylesterase
VSRQRYRFSPGGANGPCVFCRSWYDFAAVAADGFHQSTKEPPVLLWILAVVAAVFLAAFLWAKSRYQGRSDEDEIHFVRTADGWRLALHRYRPRGDHPHGEPVLLHHGLASNHYSFDLGAGPPDQPSPSLARWLADRGYDVWAVDLRGRGASERPPLFSPRWHWSMDDYIRYDDPAFVTAILAHSRYENLHWIGHSMGGILLFCHCGLHGSPRVASGIAVGSGLEYRDTGSRYQPFAPYKRYVRPLGRVPLGSFAKIFSPVCGRWRNALEEFNYHLPNMSPAAARVVYGGVISNTSSDELYQLASMFEPGGLRSLDGSVQYSRLTGRITTPLLLIAGDDDRQSSVQLAEQTHRLLPGDQHQLSCFGPAYGHATHYGHFDLLVGRHAEREVFPHILNWLRSHPAHRRAE